MRVSLEELALRWRLAHTIALAAWVLVLILGIMLLAKGSGNSYPKTDLLKVYAGENLTLTYPANWTINNCVADRQFIELPGTIGTDYKGRKADPLKVYGSVAYTCLKGRPERFDVFPETITASANPCSMETSTKGERLSNGLYLQLQEEGDYIVAIYIRQNACFAPMETYVLSFGFSDPDASIETAADYGLPRVKKDTLLLSPQFLDIKALAESIRY